MNYLRFFSQVVFCSGYTRFLVLDMTTGQIHFYPAKIGQLISDEVYQSSIERISEKLNSQDRELFQSVIDDLVSNNLGFITNTPCRFPSMTGDYNQKYSDFENAHVIFSKSSLTHLKELMRVLDKADIKAVKLDFTSLEEQEILTILHEFNTSGVYSIECIIDLKNDKLSGEHIDNICSVNGAVTMLSILNPPIEALEYSSEVFISNAHKPYPKIVPSFELYCEAINVNPYYNGKLFIGSSGEVKMSEKANRIHGYVSEASINQVIAEDINLKKFWGISKDLIDVCKDCEFRYFCVDDRQPKARDNGTFFFEEECRFNPYISRWSDELGYMKLIETGVNVTESETLVNSDKVIETNKQVWQG